MLRTFARALSRSASPAQNGGATMVKSGKAPMSKESSLALSPLALRIAEI